MFRYNGYRDLKLTLFNSIPSIIQQGNWQTFVNYREWQTTSGKETLDRYIPND